MLQKTEEGVNIDVDSNVVALWPTANKGDGRERGRVVKADLDDGYLRLSNTLVDALCRTKLSDRESRVLFAVVRRTYGYGKSLDWLSYSQIEEMTDIDPDNVSRVIGGLLKRNIFIKEGKKLGINTVISQWFAKPAIAKTVTKTASLDSKARLSESTEKPVSLDSEPVSLDSKTCQSRPPQKKDNITKERQKDICPKSAFNPVFKLYPAHRKGGSDSAAWTAWKSEKLTEADCSLAIDWLTQAAIRDPSWGAAAGGQFVVGVTKFIRNRIWLTPLPQMHQRSVNPLQVAAHQFDHNPYAGVADDFNTEL